MNGLEAACFIRLGKDADPLKHVRGGELPLLTFSGVIDQQRADDEPPQWLRVAVFGERAEQLAGTLTKGCKVYIEGPLTVDLWLPDDGRTPRVNLQMVGNVVVPIGIGNRRPKSVATAARGQRAWNNQRHAAQGRAQAAGEAILREASTYRQQQQEPPQSWLDDSREAIADLEGRGR